MDVEIDDRRALGAMLVLGVARRDRGIVEQAKAHRARGLGVMAGRADGDEGIGGLAGHHLIDRVNRAAGATQRGLETAGRHRGIGVDLHQALLRRGVLNGRRRSPWDGRARWYRGLRLAPRREPVA